MATFYYINNLKMIYSSIHIDKEDLEKGIYVIRYSENNKDLQFIDNILTIPLEFCNGVSRSADKKGKLTCDFKNKFIKFQPAEGLGDALVISDGFHIWYCDFTGCFVMDGTIIKFAKLYFMID